MNLIDESFDEVPKVDNTKKISKIILAIIVILIVGIIGIFIAITYIQSNTLRLALNGSSNEKVLNMMVEEANGTIYFPIKDIAPYLTLLFKLIIPLYLFYFNKSHTNNILKMMGCFCAIV